MLTRDMQLLEQLYAAPLPGATHVGAAPRIGAMRGAPPPPRAGGVPLAPLPRERLMRATEARIRREALLVGLPECAPSGPPGMSAAGP